MKKPLSGMLPDNLLSELELDRSFRALQLFRAIHKNHETIDQITTLPRSLRDKINENYAVLTSECDQVITDNDGSTKFRIILSDKNCIESVVLNDITGRKTACLSTQAGCAMGCRFCKTGEYGFKRNLTAAEITEQLLIINSLFNKISNIVYMGMGEPLENLENLFQASAVFNHQEGAGISCRKMTVSTCGITDKINIMALEGPGLRLAVSLNCAIQKKREIIMPAAKIYPLEGLKNALEKYQAKRGKRITLEYVLINGFNTTEEDAAALKKFTKGLSAVINLIPLNPVKELPWKTPQAGEIQNFTRLLDNSGINYTLRRKKGSSINGACGQLAGEK